MGMSKRIFVLRLRPTRKMAEDLKKKTVYGYALSQQKEQKEDTK